MFIGQFSKSELWKFRILVRFALSSKVFHEEPVKRFYLKLRQRFVLKITGEINNAILPSMKKLSSTKMKTTITNLHMYVFIHEVYVHWQVLTGNVLNYIYIFFLR